MVVKTRLTNGKTINTMFSKLRSALLELSSIRNKKKVSRKRKIAYAITIRLRRISISIYRVSFSMGIKICS